MTPSSDDGCLTRPIQLKILLNGPPEEHEGEEGGDEVPSLLDGGGGGRMRSRNGGGGRGLLSREATDYDTFGSIDSLIFEPKLNEQSAASTGGGGNKNEDIKKAHKVRVEKCIQSS